MPAGRFCAACLGSCSCGTLLARSAGRRGRGACFVRFDGSETALTGARGMREGLPAAAPHMPVCQWGYDLAAGSVRKVMGGLWCAPAGLASWCHH